MIPKHKRKNYKTKVNSKSNLYFKTQTSAKKYNLIWDTVFDNSVRWKPLNELRPRLQTS